MLNEPTASDFDSPKRVEYYRELTAAFWAGIALGRKGRSLRLGYAAIALGSLGLAIGGFLLLTVGLCGPWVLGGHCRP
jgi:hypothetical protein